MLISSKTLFIRGFFISYFFYIKMLYRSVLQGCLHFPAPGPGSQFVFTGPGSQFVLPVLASNLYLHAQVYNFITSPGPWFCIYRPCLLTICITGLWPEFAFTLLLLVVESCNSSSSNFFGIDNTNICMPILVN